MMDRSTIFLNPGVEKLLETESLPYTEALDFLRTY
jgi:hypothetical protein